MRTAGRESRRRSRSRSRARSRRRSRRATTARRGCASRSLSRRARPSSVRTRASFGDRAVEIRNVVEHPSGDCAVEVTPSEDRATGRRRAGHRRPAPERARPCGASCRPRPPHGRRPLPAVRRIRRGQARPRESAAAQPRRPASRATSHGSRAPGSDAHSDRSRKQALLARILARDDLWVAQSQRSRIGSPGIPSTRRLSAKPFVDRRPDIGELPSWMRPAAFLPAT